MDTKEKLFISALKVFVDNGFSATTASITEDAGVSTGILFHYFNTKSDLIFELYAKILSEFYSVAVLTLREVPQNDVEKYKSFVRSSQDSMVNWGLNNWQKFQFIQLFTGSLLANQFILQNNKAIDEMYQNFNEITRLGIEFGYLKNLPLDFLTEIGIEMSTFIIKYLHKNPNHGNEKKFREKVWQIQWNIISK